VKDGRVVLTKGYEAKKLGDPAAVDELTRFGIASNTKGFTATALGLLVEEGKLQWDAPVVRYLPWFQMWDPYVARELTIREGVYTDAWYGDVAIVLEGARLATRFTKTPALIGDLEHYEYDTFIARWRDRELRVDAYVTFALLLMAHGRQPGSSPDERGRCRSPRRRRCDGSPLVGLQVSDGRGCSRCRAGRPEWPVRFGTVHPARDRD
jgi:beta-lactamase family protein/uncharacterized protein DUF3471